jgi:hypothetical protein
MTEIMLKVALTTITITNKSANLIDYQI